MKFVILLSYLYCATGQLGDEPETTNKKSGFGGGGETSSDCECVPYYLCNNGTINDNGAGIFDVRIDDNPCKFMEVCCKPNKKLSNKEEVEETTLQTTDYSSQPQPTQGSTAKCGIRNPEGVGFRITGGKEGEAQFGEFPWMCAVLRKDSATEDAKENLVYQCGASLIHPQVALTVAHWVTAKDKEFVVLAGEWDTQNTDELFPHQKRDVESIARHPKFASGPLTNDYALLFLSSPFEIAENVNVICLPPPLQEVDPGTKCFASGWGKDGFEKKANYQVILKKVELPIVERENCQEALRKTRLRKNFVLHETLMCAGGETGKDTCKGDGGSPLVCPVAGHPGKYAQYGIVSWGIGCGMPGTPGVYADVSKAISWIEEEMQLRNFDMSSYKP